MQTNDFSNLPTSWQIKTLGEVCEICTGNSINKEKKEKEFMGLKEGLNYIATKDIGFDNTINYDNGVKIPFKDLKKFRVAKANVSLLCIEGGSAGRKIGFTNQEVCFVNKLCCFEALQDEPKFIYFYLQSSYFLQKFNLNMSGLIGGISKEKIKQIKIPLPPLEIQKRIVARLESAFEKIEKGSAHLQDAKTKLAKYKQSLLKSAFDGTLFCHTGGEARSISNQEFRDISLTLNMTNSPSLRASVASVANQNNDTTKAIDCHSPNGLRNDSTHSSLRGVEKAETIHKVDCHDLTSSKLAMTDKENPKLPQGWTIKTLGEVCEICTGNSINKEKKEKEFMGLKEGLNYIATKDIGFDNTINYDNGVKIPFKDLKKFRVAKANVSLLCIEGGSAGRKIGFTNQEVCFVNKLCCFEALQDEPKFIYFYLQSSYFLQKFNLNMSGLIGGISKEKIKQIKIPLPPLEIQKQIVKLLEKHLQHADKTGEFIESALNKAKQLKQSLLKSAFLGKLT